MTVADMCDPKEDKQMVRLMVGIDDVSGELPDPSLTRQARQEEMRGFEERKACHHVLRSVAKADPEGKVTGVCWVECERMYEGGAESKEQAGWSRLSSWRAKGRSLCLDTAARPRARVEESKAQVTTAYFCWTSKRLSCMATFPGTYV